MLCAFIITYLGATIFAILQGVPFNTLVVLWINFAIQVPIAMALGFDKPSPGLMDRKPRPLSQPVLSRSQWLRLVFTGLLIAIATLILEGTYEPVDPALAATMGFVVFSLLNIALGLSARSETGTVFNGYNLADRRQLGLYGLALLLILLPVEFGIGDKILLTTPISGQQWLICLVFTLGMLLIDEVIKLLHAQEQSSSGSDNRSTDMAPARLILGDLTQK
jgi:Ca2+-transporting ATPase